MGTLTSVIRSFRNIGVSNLLLGGAMTMGAAQGLPANRPTEIVEAHAVQAGQTVAVTLIVYGYSLPSDLQILSDAFVMGQDMGLVSALSRMKPAGRVSISGLAGYDVAFIQMTATPTGRQITYVASRPHVPDGTNPNAPFHPFDLAIGQFDLNDADQSKSTGFLFPASKLAVDGEGAFHFDLTGSFMALANVLDSKQTSPGEVLAQGPEN
jgi:hypothetical protein